ncbi:GNAT family N-acetyltransferase [Aquimarina aquimarini]|uniref:GNAT family N-acetyltransferase n=1 Tax=Aquimarina aquimarini TaxID=1191734 RepID=UPI000D54FDA5|nr:GNAT family N-acetyltransferase [Aquimarina aquimarini]
MAEYIFTSQRLGFRTWTLDDLDLLTQINNDDDVMEFFPFKPSREETASFIVRMQKMYAKKGFCYFAIDLLDTKECIGFVGLSEQTYLEELGTFTDIGWRLKKSSWNHGYATEGAKACLKFGFETIGLNTIYSVASKINLKSESVMKKIEMQQVKTFAHPKLLDDSRLKDCILYKKYKTN